MGIKQQDFDLDLKKNLMQGRTVVSSYRRDVVDISQRSISDQDVTGKKNKMK